MALTAALLALVGPAHAAAQGRAPEFAPYAAARFTPDLAAWAKATGARQAILAFHNANGIDCTGQWPADEAALLDKVQAFRALGGAVIVSTGGWNADDLAGRCPDAQSLADAYQLALDRMGVTRLDVDVEAGDRHDNLDAAEVDLRSAALKRLQDAYRARGRRLQVSLTLAVSPERGLDPRPLYVLQSAKAAGVEIAVVNAMVMNFRDEPSATTMGERSIQALLKLRGQLETLYPGRPDRAYWAMMGATAMIGQNDDTAEVFDIADVERLAAFARQKHLARIGFWALSRDNGSCPGAAAASVLCDGLAQDDWMFTRAFVRALRR